jgi:hypothetical protein
MPYQILAEANFLVNLTEKAVGVELAMSIKEKIFKTKAGIQIFEEMYGI